MNHERHSFHARTLSTKAIRAILEKLSTEEEMERMRFEYELKLREGNGEI